MKNHTVFELSSCSSCSTASMKRVNFNLFNAFIVGAIFSISSAIQAAPCIRNAAGFVQPNICNAKDVKLMDDTFVVINPPPSCVLGSTFLIQLQANLISTAGERYNTGFWIAQDGGNAIDGNGCYEDYLPPTLTTTPASFNPITSPFLEANVPPNIAGGCGDIDKNGFTQRNIGGTTFPGPVGPPAQILVTCVDNVMKIPIPELPGQFDLVSGQDGIADISACVSWSNDKNVGPMNPPCTSFANTIPMEPSKCNCDTANLGIPVVECDATHPCVAPDACTSSTCVDGQCVEAPIPCNPTNICFTAECVDPAGCVQTPVTCDSPPVCQGNGTCQAPTGCVYTPIAIDPRCPAPNHCENGICVPPPPGCETAQDCPCPSECQTVECIQSVCVYFPIESTPENPVPCGFDDV